jgi:multiple antibiotic resistance protein
MGMNLYAATLTMFFMMNPLGNVPVFASILKGIDPKLQKKIIIRESFIALMILLSFLFFGKQILHSISISQSALSIAGGIILFLIAVKMIFPGYEDHSDAPQSEPFLVPLAVPLFAGPAAMTMTMLLGEQNIWITFTALMISWFLSAVILLASFRISKIMRARGLAAIKRLMGMVLTTIAVQMFLSGIKNYFFLMK